MAALVVTGVRAAAPDLRTADEADVAAYAREEVRAGRVAELRPALAAALKAAFPAEGIPAEGPGAGASRAAAQHEFFRQAGDAAVTPLAAEAEGREFLGWLLGSRDALEHYLTAAGLMTPPAGRGNGLRGWLEIWREDPGSHTNGPWLRAAAALAVSFAEARRRYDEDILPASRYRFYRREAAAGRILPYFLEAPAWELVLTVHGGGRPNDELEWALDITPPAAKNQKDVGGIGHSTMAYRGHNYRGTSVQTSGYYDYKPGTLALNMEYGAVCGGISHQNSTIANAHGIPAFTCGQPGHCAYVWKSDRSTWSGGNFVSGWAQTHDSHQQPFWFSRYSANVNLLSAAFAHPGFAAGERLRWLAAALAPADPAAAAAALAASTRANPLHPGAWHDRIRLAEERKESDPSRGKDIAAGVIRAFTNHPTVMVELLAPIEADRLWPAFTDAERTAYAAGVVKAIGLVEGRKQWDLDDPALRTFLQRQIGLLGIPDRPAGALLEGRVQRFRPRDAKEDRTPWQAIPPPRRPFVESHFRALAAAAENKADALRPVALAYLTLTAEDPEAGGRARDYFRAQIGAATRLDRLEPLAAAALAGLKGSADARADLVELTRRRMAQITALDAGSLQRLQGLLAQYDFRERGALGRWDPSQFSGTTDEKTLQWDVSSSFRRAADDYAIHLCFRWEAGAPITVNALRLLQNGQEVSADRRKSEPVDDALLPVTYTLALKDPQPAATYTLEAVVSGGGKDSRGAVLGRGERQPAFEKDEFVAIGGWGGKTWKEWPEVTEGWHEGSFDITPHVKKPGTIFARFQYGSYAGIQVMNVRLYENGRPVAQDLHVGRVMGSVNNQFALALPAVTPGASYALKALFSKADGYGTVYLRKQ